MKNAKGLFLLLLSVLIAGAYTFRVVTAEEPDPHEYAPIEAVTAPGVDVAAWLEDEFSGETRTGATVDALEVARTHDVVIYSYFAEWCSNCRYEAPVLSNLYERYGDRGLEIIARSEYSHPDVVTEYVDEFDFQFPVILGSPNPDPEDEDAVRTTSGHYELRRALGDDRKWGTPFNLVIVDGDLENPLMVKGEFVPTELEALLEEEIALR